MPPETVIGPELNATPTSPTVVAAQVAERGALMVRMQEVLVAPFASVTFTLKLPLAVGVPVISPVAAFSVRPAGSVPTMEYA